MEIAKLVLEYLQALVWPAVVALLLILLRKEIRGLVGRLTNAELLGAKLAFDKELQQAEVDAGLSQAELRSVTSSRSTTWTVEEPVAPDAEEREPFPEESVGESGADISSLMQLLEQLSIPATPTTLDVVESWNEFTADLHGYMVIVGDNSPRKFPVLVDEVARRLGLPESWETSALRLADVYRRVIREQARLAEPEIRSFASTVRALHDQFRAQLTDEEKRRLAAT